MFLAVDVARLMGEEEIRERMAEYRDYIRNIPTISGKLLILPGELENACAAERTANGIPLPSAVYDELQMLAKDWGLSADF